MTIRDVDACIYDVPIRHAGRYGVGPLERVRNVLVRVRAEDGAVGYGEASPWPVFEGTAEGVLAAVQRHLGPALAGAQAHAIAEAHARMDRALAGHPFAKAAVDLALHDLLARRWNVPLYQVLGGPVRDRVQVGFSLAQQDQGADVAEARALIGRGIKAFKVKTGLLPLADELARLEAIRGVLPPDGDLRVDFNQGLPSERALETVLAINELRPTFIEQPVPRWDIASMARIRARLTVPLMADESVFSLQEAAQVARMGAADIVSIKLMKCGGIYRARQIAAVCEAFGMACYAGAMWEAGIGIAAALHFAASTPVVRYGSDFYIPDFLLEDDMITRPLPMEDGYMLLPDGPGLGVEPELDALRRWATTPVWTD